MEKTAAAKIVLPAKSVFCRQKPTSWFLIYWHKLYAIKPKWYWNNAS